VGKEVGHDLDSLREHNSHLHRRRISPLESDNQNCKHTGWPRRSLLARYALGLSLPSLVPTIQRVRQRHAGINWSNACRGKQTIHSHCSRYNLLHLDLTWSNY